MEREVLWKVCRLEDIHSARFSAQLGADILGLHAICDLPEDHAMLFKNIVSVLSPEYPDLQYWLLTKINEPNQINDWIAQTGVSGVQLHEPPLKADELRSLTEAIRSRHGQNFGVIPVLSAKPDEYSKSQELIQFLAGNSREYPYILVDSAWRGGTGVPADVKKLSEFIRIFPESSVLIAGGLDSTNVEKKIEELRPAGVDMQSSLEVPWSHKKSPERLLEMARCLGRSDPGYWQNTSKGSSISVSITDVKHSMLEPVLQRIAKTDADGVHLDHSDATLAPHFLANCLYHATCLRHEIPCMPYDVHSFIRVKEVAIETMLKYKDSNPLLRTVFLYLDDSSSDELSRVEDHLQGMRNHGFHGGIAFSSRVISSESRRSVVSAFSAWRVDRLNFVTKSSRGSVRPVDQRGVNRLMEFANLLDRRDSLELGIDREIDPRKLEAFSPVGLQSTVSGRYLLELEDMQQGITKLRSML